MMKASAVDQNMSRKLKVQLKLAVNRLRLAQQKQTALAKQSRRDLANLLELRKEESARIRVENVILEDIYVELLELLELYCELLLARFGLLDQTKDCDPGLEEAVKTIIHAAPKSEVKELMMVRELLIMRFGKVFGQEATDNSDHKVNERVMSKLTYQTPSPALVASYLKEIARTYNVPWTDELDLTPEGSDNDEGNGGGEDEDEDDEGNVLEKAELPEDREPAVSIAPPSPSTENRHPILHLPPSSRPAGSGRRRSSAEALDSASKAKSSSVRASAVPSLKPLNETKPATTDNQGEPSIDDLMRRFEELKKR